MFVILIATSIDPDCLQTVYVIHNILLKNTTIISRIVENLKEYYWYIGFVCKHQCLTVLKKPFFLKCLQIICTRLSMQV